MEDIPIGSPTILAGPNDGGKSSALDAVKFLLGRYSPIEDDRTYLEGESGGGRAAIDVSGRFLLDEWEQEQFSLPAEIELRRIMETDQDARYEVWGPIPDDEDLRDLAQLKVPDLKELARRHNLRPKHPGNKPELLVALQEYAREHSSGEGWTGAPPNLTDRLPRVVAFTGKTLDPEAAVAEILGQQLKGYLQEESTRKQIEVLEDDAQDWLVAQAQPLVDHITRRCKDITEVTVKPEISMTPRLRSASLGLRRSSGEQVRLDRSGQGSARRISLAVWEASTDILVEEQQDEEMLAENGPPVPTIVVYDEPDTHLDYHYQRDVMGLIREQCQLPNTNVVVATHSMNLIDGVDLKDVVRLELDEKRRTRVERLGADTGHDESDRHLQSIATAVGLRNSVLLHERCFLAVEGETEQKAIPILFKLSEGLQLQSAGIALWACGGNSGALHLADYLYKHGRSVVLLIDADCEVKDKMFRRANLEKVFSPEDYDNVVTFLGKAQGFMEFEELFDDSTWADTANEQWPRTDRAPWGSADFAAHRKGKKFSDQVMTMLKSESKTSPSGKPALVMEVVNRLKRPDQVPQGLRDVFADLRKSAS
ncbi:putative ATP-dependent endonuclease of the OLD family, contains P-loop ATPase and TOPRIM domains [Actinosynnema pretiosum]|nr:putative ATP-dependent endonuclease of the OLD family, contains P-loop ATPase and TOPRIM domains [Actinosynnema pretiosum]